MKKITTLTLTLAIAFLFVGNVFAQSTATENISVNAEIVGALEINIVNNLIFGLLTADEDGFLSTGVAGTESQGIISGEELGQFEIIGQLDEAVTVEFDASVTLARLTGTGADLTYTPFLSFDDNGDQTELTNGGSVTLNEGAGLKTILVGGGVNSDGVAAGEFEGSLEITVSYVSI